MGLCVSKREYLQILSEKEKLDKENEILQKKNENLQKENERLNSQIININKEEEYNPIKFYDIIIHIKSIKDITKGWKVQLSPRIDQKYKEYTKDKVIKVGVIGNSNKGKSYILSKISGVYLPFGTSLKTQGLSIKFPEKKNFQNKRLALLDSAGLETPVLLEGIKNKNEINGNDFENINKNLQKKIELFKIESRDKIITELFLQNYIIHYSDILLLIVGILTYSEQKLLNKVKSEIRKTKIDKTLYVIHNLMTFTTRKQVENYIKETLLKSATFDLEMQIPGIGVSECYYEKNTKPAIKHLFFANEGSEAGNYYNKYTLDYLEKDYNNVMNLKDFDVLETVKERFKNISKDILEKNEIFDNNQNEIVFDNTKKDAIKLINPKEIKLKKCLIDELGFQNLKSNGYEPSYNVIKNEKEIFIMVEAPGDSQIEKTEVFRSEGYFIVRIIGNKDKEPVNKGTIIYNTRESGKFHLEVPFKLDEFWLKNSATIYEGKRGMFIIKLELEK